MKVYIGKTKANDVIIDVNPQVLKDAEIVLTMPLEEYQSLGHRSVEIVFENGKAVLKLKESVETQKKITDLKTELELIDKESGAGRAIREIVVNMDGVFKAFCKTALGIKEVVKTLGKDYPGLEKNLDSEALEIISGYNSKEHVTLQRIAGLEIKAEVIRGQLRPLLEPVEELEGN